jgi:hypothetical protein
MTTKKQRRANVAAKRAEYDAETRRIGLAAQQRGQDEMARRRAEKDAQLEQIFGKAANS